MEKRSNVRKPPYGARSLLGWIHEETALISADMIRLAEIIAKKEVGAK